MARRVGELMNREVFHVTEDTTAKTALVGLMGLGITGAPVVNEAGQCVGEVSIRKLVDHDDDTLVRESVRPATTVFENASIDEVARRMVDNDAHRVVVVNKAGAPTGVLTPLDILRGVLGLPASHPATFPHFDTELGVEMADPLPFSEDQVDKAPDGPGILVLIYGGRGVTERIVWVEDSPNVRTRLSELLSIPQDNTDLRTLLDGDHQRLRFVTAPCTNDAHRHRAVSKLWTQVVRWPPEVDAAARA